MTTTGVQRPLLDLPAVAELLGVNERRVRRLVAERRFRSSSRDTCCASTPTTSTVGWYRPDQTDGRVHGASRRRSARDRQADQANSADTKPVRTHARIDKPLLGLAASPTTTRSPGSFGS